MWLTLALYLCLFLLSTHSLLLIHPGVPAVPRTCQVISPHLPLYHICFSFFLVYVLPQMSTLLDWRIYRTDRSIDLYLKITFHVPFIFLPSAYYYLTSYTFYLITLSIMSPPNRMKVKSRGFCLSCSSLYP